MITTNSGELTTENDVVLCDEFYYAIVKDEQELSSWLNGLKLVYTYDDTDDLDFESAYAYMDDDQEIMFEAIAMVVCSINPSLIINNLYVNHTHNADGSTNLIKVICVSFILANGEFLVCKAPWYAFDKEKTMKFIEETKAKILKEEEQKENK